MGKQIIYPILATAAVLVSVIYAWVSGGSESVPETSSTDDSSSLIQRTAPADTSSAPQPTRSTHSS